MRTTSRWRSVQVKVALQKRRCLIAYNLRDLANVTSDTRLYDYDCTTTPFHPSARLQFAVQALARPSLDKANAISRGASSESLADVVLKTWRPFTVATPDDMLECMNESTEGFATVYEHVPTSVPRHFKMDFDKKIPEDCEDVASFMEECMRAADVVVSEAQQLLQQRLGVNTNDMHVVRMLSVPWRDGMNATKFSAHAVLKVRHRMWADFDHEKRFAHLLKETLTEKREALALSVLDMAVYTRNAYVPSRKLVLSMLLSPKHSSDSL